MANKSPLITMIVAMATNQAIGKDNELLWHLPHDLKFFKKTTSGHTVIMGRKTFESIGRPLPNRRNIVITRNSHYNTNGAEIVSSVPEALNLCLGETEVFVIGGAEIYRQFLPLTDRIYLTKVDAQIDGHAFFSDLNEEEWQYTKLETHPRDEQHAYSFTFFRLDRVV